MTRVVINECFGGFGLSVEGSREYLRRTGKTWTETGGIYGGFKVDGEFWHSFSLPRTDPVLIAVVEELGKDANSWAAELRVIEIPDDVEWHIHEYDGSETIHENHRSWDSDGQDENC